MMKLAMQMPPNMYSEILMGQSNIPCRCTLRDNKFVIELTSPLHPASGSMAGWDLLSITERAPAGAGGEYLYDCHGMLSVDKIGKNDWRVTGLEFFIGSVGWCPIIVEGGYSEARHLDDIDDF